MKKTWVAAGLVAVTLLSSACGAQKEAAKTGGAEATKSPAATAAGTNETRKITYLGKEYTVPSKAERIVVAGSFESMEDALVLGVKPIGANSVGGKFPDMFKSITDKAESVGEKTQPNLETILKLKPDVILGSTKFPPEMMEKMNKVKVTLPISHVSTDWEANLNVLAELTGKQDKAKEAIEKYKKEAAAAKEKLGTSLKDKKVLAIRVRAGSIAIYPAGVFFNPSLYTDLGLAVPNEVKEAKAQQLISLEKLSEINPDYMFVQFSEDENKEQPKALEDLEKNPIWQSINAVKNKKMFVNVVDPLAQGGTSYSKIKFLEAALPKLTN
ncbi:ABC transporter substrate-binding protein [Paenibacillus sp. GbtcB18]|uniref:ABC transporter substrate-binding protein n=1 Tax=Paenibacillus sp. GbtcB18 TaxID=2824763 RepID=UPI001C2F32D7|nr:ABC transporter substrate-binding protein [Paenibacillus sp. GbtcB18]